MKVFFQNLKINQKLFLILVFVSSILSIIGITALQLSFCVYEEQLYEEASEALILASEIADMKLNEMDKMSFDILSDNEVQEYLATIRNQNSLYNRYEALDKLNRQVHTWAFNENYVSSINIIDTRGNQYSWGKDTIEIEKNRLEFIRSQAIQQEGGVAWIEPYRYDSSIIAARVIRSIPDLELANLGTMIIRMNPEKLFDNFPNQRLSNEYDSNFAILSENGVLYQRNDQLGSNELILKMNKKTGYFIDDIQGDKYLVAYITSQHTGWKFASILPYSSILKNIMVVRTILILVYIGIFVLVMYLGFLFSKSITRPFKRLANEMKMVEEGEFEKIAQADMNMTKQGDEIAQLEYDFHLMVDKINTLIKDNYLKQIAVKESEFKALQAQINPHFLYNTLDSINWLAKVSKQYQIAAMVKALGSLLRNSISNKKEVISLKDEMSILEDYITIQRCRYEERLDFSMDIQQDYWEYMIPKLSIQPLVENSIQYGLEKILGICKIRVWAEPSENGLKIWVQDNGPGMENDFLTKLNKGEVEPRGSGIGIKNIDDRIKIIFGAEYGIRVDSAPGKGTNVCIFVPYKRSEDFV